MEDFRVTIQKRWSHNADTRTRDTPGVWALATCGETHRILAHGVTLAKSQKLANRAVRRSADAPCAAVWEVPIGAAEGCPQIVRSLLRNSGKSRAVTALKHESILEYELFQEKSAGVTGRTRCARDASPSARHIDRQKLRSSHGPLKARPITRRPRLRVPLSSGRLQRCWLPLRRFARDGRATG